MKRMSEEERIVNQKVELARVKAGMKESTLARMVGISPQQYNKHKACIDRISAARMFKIADVLGCDVRSFSPFNNDSLN